MSTKRRHMGCLAAALAVVAAPAAALQIAQFSPQGTVARIESVKLVFDTPAIVFGDAQSPAPIQLRCNGQAPQGQGRWTDDRRWSFEFGQAPGPGVRCVATLNPDFRPLNGQSVSGKTTFSFSTGGPQLMDSRPYGSVIDEEQIFVLRFNGAVAPASLLAHAHCQVQGLGEAVPVRLIDGPQERAAVLSANYFADEAVTDPAIQLLQCKRRLPAEAEVRLVLDKGVATPSGVATRVGQVLDYTVRPPFKASVGCTRENARAACTPILPVTVSFNAPVPVGLARDIRLVVAQQERAPVLSDEDLHAASLDRVTFPGSFPEDAELQVVLPENLVDDAGRTLSNAAQFPLVVRTAAYPALVKFSAGQFGVVERFAHVPEDGNEDEYPPTVSLTVRSVEADLQGGDLRLPAGQVRDYTPQDDAQVLAWYARLQWLEGGSWSKSQLQRILKGQAPGERGRDEADVDARGVSLLQDRKDIRTLDLPKSDAQPRPFEVIGIPMAQPGLHVLEVASERLGAALLGANQPMYVRSAALVTNLAVHIKQGRDDVLVWVTTLDEGKVVPEAQVHVLDCQGKLLAQGKTDELGRWHHQQPLSAPSYCEDTGLSGIYASARIPADHPQARGKADFSFALSSWDAGIESWRFNVPTDASIEPTRVTHTVLDRNLFRAGETVSMKHYLRIQTRDGLGLPAQDDLPQKVVVRHEGSDQSQELSVQWVRTPSGGLSAYSRFLIPKSARLGEYSIYLNKEDEYAPPTGRFRVEAFKLPVLSGSLKVDAPDSTGGLLIAPQSAQADIQIGYVAGGPAGGLPVTLSALTRERAPQFQDYDDYSFYAPQLPEQDAAQGEAAVDAQSLFLDKQAVTLDGQGAARLELDRLPTVTRPAQWLFEATFSDPNGQIQTLSQSMQIWPAAVQSGIRAGSWAQQGQPVSLGAVALQPDGKPAANVAMTVSAVARTTYTTRKRMVGGFYSYDSHTESRDLGQLCAGSTDAKGLLTCTVSLQAAGAVELIATALDAQGRASRSATTLWVSGEQEMWFDAHNDDRIDLIPERKFYEPGETAEFQVRMPFRQATALVSVEREGVLWSEVVHLQGKDPRVSVPVRPEWGPNVYVSVLVLRARLREVPWYSFLSWGWKQPRAWLGAYKESAREYVAPSALVDLSKPAFRFGLAEIRVGDRRDVLDVAVSTDKPQYPVRGRAQVKVRVTTADGTPAAHAQVAFAAVDQALLELSPNPSWDLLQAMRQRRSYGVHTATAQMQVVGRRHYGRKALPAGGGGGKSPTRELLDTLLLWQPDVQLDEAGQATLELPLNDALTTFRLVAVADHGASRFGTGSTTIASTQDLQLISGLPMLVREGDRYEAGFTVRNTTRRDMRVRVQASQVGTGLPKAELEPHVVQVAAGAAQRLSWQVEAPQGQWPDTQMSLRWLIQAVEQREDGSEAAADSLAVTQSVVPATPLSVQQAALWPLDATQPVHRQVAPPPGAQTDGNGVPRGGIEVAVRPSLAGSLPGVYGWFERYPYTCLEQLGSRAIGMRSVQQWQALMHQLPDHLDADGLASYFAGMNQGSEVLTAYLLSVSHEAQMLDPAYAIPEGSRRRMLDGLRAFVQGKVQRGRWAPQQDLDVRKLLALEALSRYGAMQPRMLDSIAIAPDRWPTSAVIDWLAILRRVPLPQRNARLAQAEQVIRARLSSRGQDLVFPRDAWNDWWWLMVSPEVNAARLILTVADMPGWREDVPRLAQGLLGSQRNGAWRTTTENLMASLALEKFSRLHEHAPLSGQTRIQLSGGEPATMQWPAPGTRDAPAQQRLQSWRTARPQTLDIVHEGSGQGWVDLRAWAAVPVSKPVSAGYTLQREVQAITQARPGTWSQGDVYRVVLTVDARTPTTWAVIDDPVPAGATLLGSALGRDSAILAGAADGADLAQPSFVERSFAGYRAYFEYLPQGRTRLAYTVRLNSAGTFLLPASRVEALYQPDVQGLLPHPQAMTVQARRP